ncbi:MAG TPA: hypothetical protein VFO38_03775 [Candidatus Saccharimonadales bacterium]|nr:hypothetical protein [Candidatus Saccharimonadales bacterium]
MSTEIAREDIKAVFAVTHRAYNSLSDVLPYVRILLDMQPKNAEELKTLLQNAASLTAEFVSFTESAKRRSADLECLAQDCGAFAESFEAMCKEATEACLAQVPPLVETTAVQLHTAIQFFRRHNAHNNDFTVMHRQLNGLPLATVNSITERCSLAEQPFLADIHALLTVNRALQKAARLQQAHAKKLSDFEAIVERLTTMSEQAGQRLQQLSQEAAEPNSTVWWPALTVRLTELTHEFCIAKNRLTALVNAPHFSQSTIESLGHVEGLLLHISDSCDSLQSHQQEYGRLVASLQRTAQESARNARRLVIQIRSRGGDQHNPLYWARKVAHVLERLHAFMADPDATWPALYKVQTALVNVTAMLTAIDRVSRKAKNDTAQPEALEKIVVFKNLEFLFERGDERT